MSIETYHDNVEELRDDRRDAAEKGGARRALHLVREAFDLDKSTDLLRDLLRKAVRIHVLDGRQQDDQAPVRVGFLLPGVELFEVAFERAGVARQVLVRRKLRGIHKDRHDRHLVLGERRIDKAEVAFVQRAHRRHKADRLALAQRLVAPGPVGRHVIKGAHRCGMHIPYSAHPAAAPHQALGCTEGRHLPLFLHTAQAMSGIFDPFEKVRGFRYSGGVVAAYPLSPKTKIPPSIKRPNYGREAVRRPTNRSSLPRARSR